jgi:hypothetical protein
LCSQHIVVVVRNTAFQFGASVLIELTNNCIVDFEVSVCKLICRKDTGCLLEQTILPRLTDGLEIIATFELHIFKEKMSDNSHLITLQISGQSPNLFSSNYITEAKIYHSRTSQKQIMIQRHHQ